MSVVQVMLSLLLLAVVPSQGQEDGMAPYRRLLQGAVSPAPVGQVCANGLVCPVHQRCDVTLLSGNDGTQSIIQCLCVTGYNGPECPLPYSAPPDPTTGPVVLPPPSPFTGTASSAAAAAARPGTVGTATTSRSSDGSDGIGVGGIIGIVVGCLVGVGLVAVGLVYAVRRRRQQRAAVEFQDFHRAHHSMELRQEPPPPAYP